MPTMFGRMDFIVSHRISVSVTFAVAETACHSLNNLTLVNSNCRRIRSNTADPKNILTLLWNLTRSVFSTSQSGFVNEYMHIQRLHKLKVNVKISDYGIARLATPTGLYSSEGTPGYRAPEVIQGEPYSVQADVFSYGVLLYELLTNGIHPYAKTEVGHRIDERILGGIPPQPIGKSGTCLWSEMEELIGQCLRWSPDDRPKLDEVLVRLYDVTSLCHRQIFTLGKGCAADVILNFKLGDINTIVTSTTNGFEDDSQLSFISPNFHVNVKGMLFRHGQVLAMMQLSTQYLLVSTQRQKMYLLHVPSFTVVGQAVTLVDSVLCLLRCRGNDFDNIVAGSTEGGLYIFNTQQLLLQMENDISVDMGTDICQRLQLGSENDAVKCCRRYSTSRVYVGVGTTVHQVQLYPVVEINKAFDTNVRGEDGIINYILRTKGGLHIIKRWSHVIQKWSVRHTAKFMHSFDVQNFLMGWGINVEHSYDCRILSACIINKEMWLGLANGCICILDVQHHTGLTIVESNLVNLKCSVSFNLSGEEVVIFSGSTRRSKSRSVLDQDQDDGSSCIAVWDVDLSTQHKVLNEYLQNFQG